MIGLFFRLFCFVYMFGGLGNIDLIFCLGFCKIGVKLLSYIEWDISSIMF